MPKLLLETRGKFQLLDFSTGDHVDAYRPSVARTSQFIQSRISAGQIHVIAELKDDATDVEFVTFMEQAEGDAELAVESFLSKYSVDADDEPEKPAPSARTKRATSKSKAKEKPAEETDPEPETEGE